MELTTTLRTELIRHLPLSETIIVEEETPIAEIIRKMEEKRRGCVLVEKENKLCGLVSERDILTKYIKKRMSESAPAREIMSTDLKTLSPEDTMEKAIRVMVRGGYRHVPLVDPDRKILGMVGARDIIDYIAEHFPAEVFNLPPHPEQHIASPEGA